MPWKQSDAISLEVVGLAVAVVLNAQSVNHFTRKTMFLWPDLDKVRVDTRNPRTGLYRDSASNAANRKCRSFLCAANFHLQSSPVSVLSVVSFASDVCILSTPQTKINTFIDKDIEVFPETCVSPMKTLGKKDCGFYFFGATGGLGSSFFGPIAYSSRPFFQSGRASWSFAS